MYNSLYYLAGSRAPYIHIILSYIVSITWYITQPLVSYAAVDYQSYQSAWYHLHRLYCAMIQYNSKLECLISSWNNISWYSVSTLPLNRMYLWQSDFGPKFLHFDDWQELGEQVCWVFFTSDMERFYNLFLILFPYVMMSNINMFCSTFDCWINR